MFKSRLFAFLWSLVLISFCTNNAVAQDISTSTPVPPLQWINLTPYTSGPSPPPLKDVSIGYDEFTRDLLIFGGESSQGFPQSQTYLMDLRTLTWRNPDPQPPTLQGSPPPRSAALSGDDVAASYRNGHVVFGGKGTNGQPLSDVWEFDFGNEFWAEVKVNQPSPKARWGAVGGMDPRTAPIVSSTLVAPNNSYYLAGGFDGQSAIPLSDVWRLNISGALTANNLDQVFGSWEQVTVSGNIPARFGNSGAVVFAGTQQHIVSTGGCTGNIANTSCADGSSYVINLDLHSSQSPPSCPAPRLSPVAATNLCGGSSSFDTQLFMLLGLSDSAVWDDGNGLQDGEVDILDIGTGSWTRILPSGDPGPDQGQPTFPKAREGAAAISLGQQLVGDDRDKAADTLVFGGRDSAGNYLNDVWILRAYNASISKSNQHWSGFGNGQLVSGPNADGAGVTVKYLTQCASKVAGSSSSTTGKGSPTSSGTPSPTQTNGDSSSPIAVVLYDTSIIHKILAPVSIAALLPAIVLFRTSSPSSMPSDDSEARMGAYYLSLVGGLAAFGIGIGGLASAFTSITTTTSQLSKRSSSSINLVTAHSKAGLAIFLALYAIIPLLLILSFFVDPNRRSRNHTPYGRGSHSRANSIATAEKTGLYANGGRSTPGTTNGLSEEATTGHRPQQRSWSTLGIWSGSRARRSSETVRDVVGSPATARSFEVVNRGQNSLGPPRRPNAKRNLSDLSWLNRRRNVHAVAELDYALSQLNPRNDPPTPGTVVLDIASTRGLVEPIPSPADAPRLPSPFASFIHILLHSLVLATCGLSLAKLWINAPRAAFAVFLAWTIAYYLLMFFLSWYGLPRISVLSTLLYRLRTDQSQPTPSAAVATTSPVPSRPISSIGLDSIPFPSDQRSPYQYHQHPYRPTATSHDHDYTSMGHESADPDDDDDVDEGTRQQQMEEEMNRRDVSIVTVPKRRLFLTNPERS